jgi:tRNA(Glu) U13 pseudouridine synthase TruD
MAFDDAMPPERAWALSATEISMPHGRMPLGDDEVSRCWRETFEAEGVLPEDLELPALPKTKPHRNLRRALVAPTGLAIDGPFDDDLNDGRRAVTLTFDLPKASYATLLVKS